MTAHKNLEAGGVSVFTAYWFAAGPLIAPSESFVGFGLVLL